MGLSSGIKYGSKNNIDGTILLFGFIWKDKELVGYRTISNYYVFLWTDCSIFMYFISDCKKN